MTTDKEKDRLFDEAVRLRNVGQHQAALPILQNLAKLDPDDFARVFVMLGDTHEQLGDVGLAIDSFRRAIEIEPQNEEVSKALFHCLWRLGEKGDFDRETEALDEIRRFVSVSSSDAYAEILMELTEKKEKLWPAAPEDEGGS